VTDLDKCVKITKIQQQDIDPSDPRCDHLHLANRQSERQIVSGNYEDLAELLEIALDRFS
jgi:hypothetical protein